MAKIIGPGSCNVDLTGYASHLPVAGETAVGDLILTSPGGKGSNQMVAAHRAGSEALLIARIGDDTLASCLHDFYGKIGFSKKYVQVCKGENTGTAIIEIDKTDAQNRILIIRGANLLLSEADVIAAEKDFSSFAPQAAKDRSIAKARRKTMIFFISSSPFMIFVFSNCILFLNGILIKH